MTSVQPRKTEYTTLNDIYPDMVGPRWMASCRRCAQTRGLDVRLGVIRARKGWGFMRYGRTKGTGAERLVTDTGQTVRCPTCKTFRGISADELRKAVSVYGSPDYTTKILI